jgi:hypothetical protein
VTDTFAEDHAAGLHQPEIVDLMNKMEPALVGHSRAIIIIAATRIIAAMLGPAGTETRQRSLEAIPITLRKILGEMDRMIADGAAFDGYGRVIRRR